MFIRPSQKGGILLKVVIILLLVLLFLAVDIPRRMWNEQEERKLLSQKRMLSLSNLQIVYRQERGTFAKDVKDAFEFAMTYDTLKVGTPQIEIEILDLDSTEIRMAYSDRDHIEDLLVKPSSGELKIIKKDRLKENHIPYDCGKEISVCCKFKDLKLNMKSHEYILSSESPIIGTAKYIGVKDTYWDFKSKTKIKLIKNLTDNAQNVNMARYIFNDLDKDPTPYLCPSTLEKYEVGFNLSAKVKLRSIFQKRLDKHKNSFMETPTKSIKENQRVFNFFLNRAKLKSERKIAELIQSYEMEGDSTFSNNRSKDSLFTVYFTEYLNNFSKKEPLIDSLATTISTTLETEKNDLSENSRLVNLVNENPGEKAIKESKKPENDKILDEIVYNLETYIVKIDTTSAIIKSPINENSDFKGIDRSLFRSKSIFGIKDDENHGQVDDDRGSWQE